MLAEFWVFLSDTNNQATLAWLGGGMMAVTGGLWTAFTYLQGRKKQQSGSQPPPATSAEQRTVQVTTGLASGADMHIKGPVTINQTRLPKTALALAALGLLLLVYAILNSGDRISVQGGSYVGGDMKGSKVTIQGGKTADP